MASKVLLLGLLAAVAAAAKDSCGIANDTACEEGDSSLLQVGRGRSQDPEFGNLKDAFFGLRVTAGRRKRELRMELECMELNECGRRTRDGLCGEWFGPERCEWSGGRHRGKQTLNFRNARAVYLQSFGVKSHTRNYVIRTKTQGEIKVFDEFDGYSAPRGSGLRSHYHYRNTQYTYESPAVFSAGDPGYVFYGSFEIQPGAKITLTMSDGGRFDLVSFDVDKLEIF